MEEVGALNISSTISSSSVTSNDDCYFYYYSSCVKGSQCPFRHEPSALRNETMCRFWLLGNCSKPNCIFRHMEIVQPRDKIPCFFESQPGGCKKVHCSYQHNNILDQPREEDRVKNRSIILPLRTGSAQQQVSDYPSNNSQNDDINGNDSRSQSPSELAVSFLAHNSSFLNNSSFNNSSMVNYVKVISPVIVNLSELDSDNDSIEGSPLKLKPDYSEGPECIKQREEREREVQLLKQIQEQEASLMGYTFENSEQDEDDDYLMENFVDEIEDVECDVEEEPQQQRSLISSTPQAATEQPRPISTVVGNRSASPILAPPFTVVSATQQYRKQSSSAAEINSSRSGIVDRPKKHRSLAGRIISEALNSNRSMSPCLDSRHHQSTNDRSSNSRCFSEMDSKARLSSSERLVIFNGVRRNMVELSNGYSSRNLSKNSSVESNIQKQSFDYPYERIVSSSQDKELSMDSECSQGNITTGEAASRQHRYRQDPVNRHVQSRLAFRNGGQTSIEMRRNGNCYSQLPEKTSSTEIRIKSLAEIRDERARKCTKNQSSHTSNNTKDISSRSSTKRKLSPVDTQPRKRMRLLDPEASPFIPAASIPWSSNRASSNVSSRSSSAPHTDSLQPSAPQQDEHDNEEELLLTQYDEVDYEELIS